MQGGLFQSPHADENDVQTISHKCRVQPFDEYLQQFGADPARYSSVYDNNDTFYSAGYYDPTAQSLKLDTGIPVGLVPEENAQAREALPLTTKEDSSVTQ